MQRILNLIEATLDADVTPAELAAQSGYSLWHFLHLFQQEAGMPLGRYVTRRRLAHALWHMSRGMPITDAALRWGFGSHSGFFRAFRKEYGLSPTEYLRTHRVNPPAVPLLKEVVTMLPREKFQAALTHWGDAYAALPLTPVTYPGSGQVSETALYAGDEYVLKAYRDDHACRLAVALADALHHQGMPAAQAIPLPDGEIALPVGGGWQMTLCRRIPGKAVLSAYLIRRPEEGRRIGAALANLHLATAALGDLPYAEDEPWAEHVLNWAIPRVQGVLDDAFLADFSVRVAALSGLPASLIHRDPNPGNLIDTAEGIAFVDFELSRRFLRMFDPCYTATAVLSEVFGRDDLPWQENWPVFVHALLAGYDSVSPLTEAEWTAAPTIMLGNEVLSIAAFVDSSKYRHIFDVNMRMLAWMLENMPV